MKGVSSGLALLLAGCITHSVHPLRPLEIVSATDGELEIVSASRNSSQAPTNEP